VLDTPDAVGDGIGEPVFLDGHDRLLSRQKFPPVGEQSHDVGGQISRCARVRAGKFPGVMFNRAEV
jgi:hypothetical protein